jgi:hypothetical protein
MVSPLLIICSKSINCVEFAGTDIPDNKGIVAKFIVAVTADEESLTIAMLVTATAILAGDVYRVALEVAAAPLYRVMDVSATIYIPFVTRIVVCKN